MTSLNVYEDKSGRVRLVAATRERLADPRGETVCSQRVFREHAQR